MKLRLAVPLGLLLCLLLGLPGGAGAQGIGVYFTIVNTYVYAKGPRAGKRYLVRPREAFNVVNVATDGQETIWYQIVYPAQTARINGTGWTATAPHELLAAPQDPVLVFSHVPNDPDVDLEVHKVPARSVELLNETQSGTPFAQVDWQRVRFQLNQPLLVWARSGAGIYRAGKTAGFLSRVYGELVTRNVSKDEQTRLLSGVVRIGDALRVVRWALGDPLRSQEETIGDARRTVWQYPEMTVTFENEVVKQIN